MAEGSLHIYRDLDLLVEQGRGDQVVTGKYLRLLGLEAYLVNDLFQALLVLHLDCRFFLLNPARAEVADELGVG